MAPPKNLKNNFSPKIKAEPKKIFFNASGESFWLGASRTDCRHTLCISKSGLRGTGAKGPALAKNIFRGTAKVKGERGNFLSRPAYSSRFALSDMLLFGYPKSCRSGRQNLAALCTAAGQNLTAVGSSHSLTETVNLGTVTIAGLIGTLHR